MLQAGKMYQIANALTNYKLDLIALQEIRWEGSGYIQKPEFTIYYSGATKQGLYGTGFIVSKTFDKCVLGFQEISERLCKLRVKGRLYNTTYICAYSPIEDASDEDKEQFYEELQKACYSVPRYDELIVLGDFNAKVGREDTYAGVIGKQSPHDITNGNGEMMCYFAAANDLFITGTKFPHKDIHKVTWRVPGREIYNQIDHILVCRRRLSNVLDVRTYRGADCDSDHFLVIASLKHRTALVQNGRGEKRVKWNTEQLKKETTRHAFASEVAMNLHNSVPDEDIEKEWQAIKLGLVDAAKNVLGERKKPRREEWYDDEFALLLQKKNDARLKYLQIGTDANHSLYKVARDSCRKTARKKKRNLENKRVQELENMLDRNLSRAFYRRVSDLRNCYQPRTNTIRDRNGNALTEKHDIVQRWRDHFQQLLRPPNQGDFQNEEPIYYNVEEKLEEPTLPEVQRCIRHLNNNKAPGLDTITSELLKAGGPVLEERLYMLIKRIWAAEEMPQEWHLGIIVPIFKKGDKTVCSNYRGITILSAAYKIFSGVLYMRLMKYAEEILGEYQCGFRPNRSTADQIHLMRQTLERAYEYDINLHHLFVDYKQAFDSVNRKRILCSMQILGVPSKIVRLVDATMRDSRSIVAIQNEQSEPFDIDSGVKQGDAISTVVFNLVLEAITRKLNLKGLIDYNTSQLAAYADDIVITSRSKQSMINHGVTLEGESAQFGLEVNASKTKYLPSSRVSALAQDVMIGDNRIEGVNAFRYLGSNLNALNMIDEEIKARITAGNKCFYACNAMLSNKLLSIKSKLTIYKTIIRPVVTYACETWTLTQKDELKLALFERKVLRKIFGPLREDDGTYRRRMNHELDQLIHKETLVRFCKSQRLRWAGHLERMDDARAVKTICKWTPQQKRPRGRPRKRWRDCVEEDLRCMGKVTSWRREARDRTKWRKLVEEAKTHKGL